MADPDRKKNSTAQQKKAPAVKSSKKKVITWIIALVLFYVVTSATVSEQIVEVEKTTEQRYGTQQPVVVEKVIKTTKYRTEKVPYGTPRCEQKNYNYSYEYSYVEDVIGGNKVGTCTYDITNEEDLDGEFTFYAQITKNGIVTDGADQTKSIAAFQTVPFSWSVNVGPADSVSCLLFSQNPPHRMKCFYLEPITYQIKQVPYVVEEKKNVTEYVTLNKSNSFVTKENVTQNIYTNQYFGYNQFFYFGY